MSANKNIIKSAAYLWSTVLPFCSFLQKEFQKIFAEELTISLERSPLGVPIYYYDGKYDATTKRALQRMDATIPCFKSEMFWVTGDSIKTIDRSTNKWEEILKEYN